MLGRGGLFRQENVEKRRVMSVREWAELCNKEDLRAPGIHDVGLHARSARSGLRPSRRDPPATHKVESVEPEDVPPSESYLSPPASAGNPPTPPSRPDDPAAEDDLDDHTAEKPKQKGKRSQTRAAREAQLAARAAKDAAFMEVFDPNRDWLPPDTSPDDYTTEFCQKLERQYWRNCGFGPPAWYGADSQGAFQFAHHQYVPTWFARFSLH